MATERTLRTTCDLCGEVEIHAATHRTGDEHLEDPPDGWTALYWESHSPKAICPDCKEMLQSLFAPAEPDGEAPAP